MAQMRKERDNFSRIVWETMEKNNSIELKNEGPSMSNCKMNKFKKEKKKKKKKSTFHGS